MLEPSFPRAFRQGGPLRSLSRQIEALLPLDLRGGGAGVPVAAQLIHLHQGLVLEVGIVALKVKFDLVAGLDVLELLDLHLDAGLEKTRVFLKNQAQCFFGFFGFLYIFAQKRVFRAFSVSFKNTFRCIQTLNYNHSY